MKLLHKLLVAICFFVGIEMSLNASPEQSRIKLHKDDYTLKELLDAITAQSGYIFAYNSKKINSSTAIHATKYEFANASQALTELLPRDIGFSIHGKFICLNVKKAETSSILKQERVASLEPTLRTSNQLNYINPIKKKYKALPKEKKESVKVETLQRESSAPKIIELPTEPTKSQPPAIDKKPSTPLRPPIRRTVRPEIKTPEPTNTPPTESHTNGLLMDVELSAFHLYGNVSINAGQSLLYGAGMYSMDANSRFIGFGLGSKLLSYNSIAFNVELTDHFIVGGSNYDRGLRVNFIQLRPTISYRIIPALEVFAGPQCYYLFKNYKDSVNVMKSDGQKLGFGATVGVKLNLIALLSKAESHSSGVRK